MELSPLSHPTSPETPEPLQLQLQLQLPSEEQLPIDVSFTRLPPSVTNLVGCFEHELGVIEDELNRCYDNDNDNDNNETDDQNEKRIESLEDAIDDGFMCVDLKVLERKLEVWHRLFSPSFCSNKNNYTVTPFFAVKCNPDPVVVEWLARSASNARLPLGFDCASIAELELAKKHVQKYRLKEIDGPNGDESSNISVAAPSTRIVYANPQRAEADLIKALELFATPKKEDVASAENGDELWLTLDGIEEVYKIVVAKKRFLEMYDSKGSNSDHPPTAPKTKPALVMPAIKIILRIWVPDGHSQVPLGEKFGMHLDQIGPVVKACLEHGICAGDIIGISFHCGSGCESVETYLEALEMGKTALNAMDGALEGERDATSRLCWLLDVGGGFPGLDGLYGDEGRFAGAALRGLEDATTTTTQLANHALEEKKEGERTMTTNTPLPTEPEPTKSGTTVADIAVAVRPVLQSFASGNNSNTNNNDTSIHGETEQEQRGEQPLTLIAEPGRYFVEGAFALGSKIYQKQIQPAEESTPPHGETENPPSSNDTDIRVYRIPHGVQGVFKDVLLCGESFVPRALKAPRDDEEPSEKLSTNDNKNSKLYASRVLGPSGDDAEDVVCALCWLPDLDNGDWLIFDRMGAYTLSIASRAGRPVMRYVMGGTLQKP